jgi:hypothetical protein
MERGCSRAERARGAEVDCLRSDDELDPGRAAPEIDLLREAARSERRRAGAILDALGLRDARQLEGDGLRQQPRLRDDRLDRDAELGEAVVGDAELDGETLGQPGQRPLQHLHRPLGRSREHRCERDPREVERDRDGRGVEVPDRDDPRCLAGDDERVRLVRVEVDCERLEPEAKSIPRRAVQLRDAPEAERVLQVARRPGREQEAPVQCTCDAVARLLLAAIGANSCDLRVEHGDVGGEPLEVESSDEVERLDQREGVGQSQRRVRTRDRVVVEERDRLASGEGEAVERTVREIGIGG